jgi:hypothetical protein
MLKSNKTRVICMNCLHSIIVEKQEEDPKNTRIIVLWSCDKCCEESDEISFYDVQMRKLDIE